MDFLFGCNYSGSYIYLLCFYNPKEEVIMKIFYLKREEDESGISGTGRVAQGLQFMIILGKFMLFMAMEERPWLNLSRTIREHVMR